LTAASQGDRSAGRRLQQIAGYGGHGTFDADSA
jgi:hypothetical protein